MSYEYGKHEDTLLNDLRNAIWGSDKNDKKGLEEKMTDLEKSMISTKIMNRIILSGVASCIGLLITLLLK